VNDPKYPEEVSMKLVKDGKEIWAKVEIVNDANDLYLTVIEKEAMTQEIVADASFMSEGIKTSGHVAIYGIYFDFNKAEVKPESEPALKEITKLLQQDPNLKLYVVGHTDNVGAIDYNMKLSQQRAEAVVKELVTKYNVAPGRLAAYGVGPLAPVTSNDTEEGQAKNRRVELVKQ
jgi:outer membrane protein OmpA-like peptidoglycan-associated protein